MPNMVKILCRAARQGNVETVEAVLAQRPETLDARNRDGRTALIVAVRHSQAGVVAALLRRGADVNGASHRSGATPVWHCAWKGDEPILGMLLAAGADPSTEATDCGTPLMVASQYGHAACVRRLLEHRTPDGAPAVAVDHAQANYRCTALWWACRSDREAVVRALLGKGADFTLTDWKGRTALDIARAKKSAGCVAALEEAHRALLLHKARTLHDAQQCVALLPCARTRRGTHEAQAARLPPCLRGRQLQHQQHQQQAQQHQPGLGGAAGAAAAAAAQPSPLPRVELTAPVPLEQQPQQQQPGKAPLAASWVTSIGSGSRKRPRPTGAAEEPLPRTPRVASVVMTRGRLKAEAKAKAAAAALAGGCDASIHGLRETETPVGEKSEEEEEGGDEACGCDEEGEGTADEQLSQGTGHVHGGHHHHHHHHHHRKKKAKMEAGAGAAAAAAVEVKLEGGGAAGGPAYNVEGTVAVARFVLDDLPEQLFVELMGLMA